MQSYVLASVLQLQAQLVADRELAVRFKLIIFINSHSSRHTTLSSMYVILIRTVVSKHHFSDGISLVIPDWGLARRLWLRVRSSTSTAGTLRRTPMSEMTASADRSVIIGYECKYKQSGLK